MSLGQFGGPDNMVSSWEHPPRVRWTHIFNHLVQRLQESNHPMRILVREVQPRRLFEAFMPHLMPEDSNSDEFVTDDIRLQEHQ